MGCLHGAIVAASDRRDRLCRRSRRVHRHATVGATGCAIDWPIIAPIVAPTVASCKQTSDRSRRRSLRLLHCVNILLDCYTSIRVRDFHDFIRVTQPACFPLHQSIYTRPYSTSSCEHNDTLWTMQIFSLLSMHRSLITGTHPPLWVMWAITVSAVVASMRPKHNSWPTP